MFFKVFIFIFTFFFTFDCYSFHKFLLTTKQITYTMTSTKVTFLQDSFKKNCNVCDDKKKNNM